ncbi:MAG: ribosome-associated translation inhibitor RaiA [Deltaproteobacteria bacterium]|nr:ribosome-associated translation inhibitor RaiA [Deltaproteobacteria bacterium]
MQFSVTFRNVEASDAIKTYARERFEKIKKYFPDPIAVNVVLSTERYNHKVDVNLQLHNGFQIAGHEATENMYSSIDMVAAKIERQVRKYKDKLQRHKQKSNFEPLPFRHSVIEEAAASEPAPEPVKKPAVVKMKEEFHAEPMTPSEAVMQLNLLHKQFLVFRDSNTGNVSVIYRRDDDDSYGLIETGGSST